MMQITDGQCGLCRHFGEHAALPADEKQQLIQIRTSRSAPADFREECGHPQHEPLNLIVTPVSGCEGFERAPLN